MGELRRTVASFAVMAIAGLALATGAAQAAKFKVLHSFCQPGHRPCGDGGNPRGALVMDAAGNFFGTTSTGGKGYGTVFELERKDGGSLKFKTLYRFCSPATCGGNPSGALVIDTAGKLYGTATNLVFELSPGGKRRQWTEKVIYRFCAKQNCADGENAVGGLTYAGVSSGVPYDGVSPLYGVTAGGGTNNGGTVFELRNSNGQWSESVLYSFCSIGGESCSDGSNPIGGVVLDQIGKLYGNTGTGGGLGIAGGAGTVFELTPDGGGSWSETVLYSFCSVEKCADGAFPFGGLAIDATGNLFGVTAAGGRKCKPDPEGCGLVFKLLPNGVNSQETVLYTFCAKSDCRDGFNPVAGLFIDDQGSLFGTTELGGGNDTDRDGLGGGVVYELSGSYLRVLHAFCSAAQCADGEYPSQGTLVSDGLGHLLGTVGLGGQFDEGGVYELQLSRLDD